MTKRHEFVVLDGLRGAAALSVVLFHFHQAWPDLMRSAYLAVDLFFLLSGFVIAHAYERRLRDGMSFGAFLRVRAIRLWPLLALGCVLGALPFAAKTGLRAFPSVALALAPNLLLIPSPPRATPEGFLFPLDIPAWSLLFEMLANLVYAAIAPWLGTRILAAATALFAVAVVVLAWAHGSLGGGDTWSTAIDGWLRVCLSFSAGVLLYRLRPPALAIGSGGHAAVSIVLMGVLVGAFAALPPTGWRWGYDLIFVLGLSPLAVTAGSALRVEGRLASLYALLGFTSYALYTLHVPVASYVTGVGRAAHLVSSVSDPRLVVVKILVVLPCALLAAAVYDVPLRRWLTARFAGAATAGAPVSRP